MKLLDGKNAIITGAARGIGEGIAIKFAEHGCNIAFTYVSDSSAEKAKAFADKHHLAKWYDDIDDLINNSGCEVVDICLPNYLHAPATLKAAAAGKHIIIEKPLAVTLEEADTMIAAC